MANDKEQRSKIGDSGVLVEHTMYMGYLWPYNVQGHLGSLDETWPIFSKNYDFQNATDSRIILLTKPFANVACDSPRKSYLMLKMSLWYNMVAKEKCEFGIQGYLSILVSFSKMTPNSNMVGRRPIQEKGGIQGH